MTDGTGNVEPGEKYGWLTAVKHLRSYNPHGAVWECKCGCGEKFVTLAKSLRNGTAKSCGCLINYKRHTMVEFRNSIPEIRDQYVRAELKRMIQNYGIEVVNGQMLGLIIEKVLAENATSLPRNATSTRK